MNRSPSHSCPLSSPLILLIFLASLNYCCCTLCRSPTVFPAGADPLKSIMGGAELGPLDGGMLDSVTASVSGAYYAAPTPRTLVLAENRTKRPNILRRFERYRCGWDVTNTHYWASVGFTGAAGFILAALWFVSFGVALMVHYFCGCKIHIEEEIYEKSQKFCIVLLICFTSASMIGCVLLSVGQNQFHSEVLQTVKYVVNQSDSTVQMLRNVTGFLCIAKSVNLSQFILPSDVQKEIEQLSVGLTSAAETLTVKTSENAAIISNVFSIVRSCLIVVAAVMLAVALLGLVLSLLGHQHSIHLFIFSGWLLVAVMFILCGVFTIFNNAVMDSCTAIEEWANNPQAETTLSDILPCVDERNTNITLNQSKEVVAGIVNVVNQFIYTYADSNRSCGDMFYYNQSGPLLPPLCYPFDYQLQDHECGIQEVSMENASVVWERYVCEVSKHHHHQVCKTEGRLSPVMYSELVAAVNASYAIRHYTPLMLNLENCNFVRQVFMNITSSHCRPLEHYLGIVVAGLGLISVGVMLCLVVWILRANLPRREEVLLKFSSPMMCNSKVTGGASRKNSCIDAPSPVPSPIVTLERWFLP